MKERPILFSGEMVRAILAGCKTQTRRVVKPTMTPPRVAPLRMEPWIIDGEWQQDDNGAPCWAGFHPDYPGDAKWFTCPYGQPGDRLWVRETFTVITGDISGKVATSLDAVEYRADGSAVGDVITSARAWRPSIFMPRAYSRITLEIVGVRCERVNEISEADAQAEGADQEFRTVVYSPTGVKDYHMPVSFRGGFANLWDEINAKRGYSWDSNPWVWAVDFKRI